MYKMYHCTILHCARITRIQINLFLIVPGNNRQEIPPPAPPPEPQQEEQRQEQNVCLSFSVLI